MINIGTTFVKIIWFFLVMFNCHKSPRLAVLKIQFSRFISKFNISWVSKNHLSDWQVTHFGAKLFPYSLLTSLHYLHYCIEYNNNSNLYLSQNLPQTRLIKNGIFSTITPSLSQTKWNYLFYFIMNRHISDTKSVKRCK